MNATVLDTFIQKISTAGLKTFTHQDVVDEFHIDGATASSMIQDYLRVLTSDRNGDRLSRVIYRKPGTRTANAIWVLGEKSADVPRFVQQTASDLQNRIEILEGTLDQVKKRNPRARRAIDAAMNKYSAAHQALVDAIVAASE